MSLDLTYADEAVVRCGRQPEALIPILQSLQDRYGYLPEAALRRVAETTDITPAAISGVASFYDMFRMQPSGKHIVRVCRGTACHVAGAERIEDALRRHLKIPEHADTDHDRQFTIESVACLGTCTLAPVVKMGETTFGHSTAERIPEALREFLELQRVAKSVPSTEELRPRHGNGGMAEIHVGLGSCCMAKGSDKLFHALHESAVATGAKVLVKRTGCVGMCHRTPMIEVAEAGKPGTFYSDLTAAQAQALVQRHFKPRGLAHRVSRWWTRILDGLLLDDPGEQRGVQRFSMSKRDPSVRAFLDKQVHIATEHFGKLDPLDLDEYLASGGVEALAKGLGVNEPLTPALSPSEGERENRSQVLKKSGTGVGAEGFKLSRDGQTLSPLPGGEGQGEGERQNKLDVISTIEKSGLRGRGGAGFPSGQKWRVVSQQKIGRAHV